MTLAKTLLNNHDVEVHFIVDAEWASKLAKLDGRFKFGIIEYDNSEQKNQMLEMLNKFEAFLKLPLLERVIGLWESFLEQKTILEIDIKSGNFEIIQKNQPIAHFLLFRSEQKIRELRPDVLLCDHVFHLPSMHSLGIPFFFIASANPLVFNIDGFPRLGLETSIIDHAEIKRTTDALEECRLKCAKLLESNFEKCGGELPKGVAIDVPVNLKTGQLYVYPFEGKTEQILLFGNKS